MKNKTWKLTLALLAAAFVIGGCYTMEGAGKDIERGGEKIQEQSRR